jgi:hypothetical protein
MPLLLNMFFMICDSVLLNNYSGPCFLSIFEHAVLRLLTICFDDLFMKFFNNLDNAFTYIFPYQKHMDFYNANFPYTDVGIFTIAPEQRRNIFLI